MGFFVFKRYISSNFSPPPTHTLEHNGFVERRHRHIVETGLTLLSHASIPNTYWTYAFATAVYLIKRMPTPTLSLQSPFQALFKTIPNYNKLRIFGSLCFPWLRPYTTNKLEQRSKPCIFLGYSLTQSAYLCLDPTQNRIYTSCHVRFDESKFPFKSLITTSTKPNIDSTHSSSPIITTIPLTAPPLIDAHTVAPPMSSSQALSSDSSLGTDGHRQDSPQRTHPSSASSTNQSSETSSSSAASFPVAVSDDGEHSMT